MELTLKLWFVVPFVVKSAEVEIDATRLRGKLSSHPGSLLPFELFKIYVLFLLVIVHLIPHLLRLMFLLYGAVNINIHISGHESEMLIKRATTSTDNPRTEMQIKCLTPSSSISVFFFCCVQSLLIALWPALYLQLWMEEEIMKQQN